MTLYQFQLKKACINRGLTFSVNDDGETVVNGKPFISVNDAEDYIATFTRKDIPG